MPAELFAAAAAEPFARLAAAAVSVAAPAFASSLPRLHGVHVGTNDWDHRQLHRQVVRYLPSNHRFPVASDHEPCIRSPVYYNYGEFTVTQTQTHNSLLGGAAPVGQTYTCYGRHYGGWGGLQSS